MLIFAAGALGLALAVRFGRERNRPLITLTAAGILYGIRLLAAEPFIRALVPVAPAFWHWLDAAITYVILVPALAFVETTFGPGWRGSIRRVRQLATIYAVVALLTDIVLRRPGAAMAPNGPLAVVGALVIIANSFRSGPVWHAYRLVRGGILVFGVSVLYQNVGGASRGTAPNIEWVGVLALVGSLGYVAVSRAVETNRRFAAITYELQTARQIQASIVPRITPQIEHLAIAARYVPMAEVAGDFYDFLVVGPAQLGILVADVSGHGVPAALIASMVKVALVAQAEHAADPARVCAGMNQIFCGRLERHFVTAAYVFVDLAAGTIRWATAGHPPPLLLHDGAVDQLDPTGIMLGHFPDWPYTTGERRFSPGDRLIVYTDGVIEAADPAGMLFGIQGLEQFALEHRAVPAALFADRLVGRLKAWTTRADRAIDDDLTVVIVDWTRAREAVANGV